MTDIHRSIGESPDHERSIESRMSRARFRAWHRGTREADFLIGGFYDARHENWAEADLAWFEDLLDEDDVDVMAWALAVRDPPERFAGPQLDSLRRLDFVHVHA